MAGNKVAGALGGAGSGALAGAAVGGPLGAGIGAGLGGLAGLFGASSGDDADARAQALLEEAAQNIKGVSLPELAAMKVALEKYRSAGVYNPELEKAVEIGDSQAAKIQTDPRLKQMQMNALMNLAQQSQTGLSAQQKADLNAARRTIAQDVEGKQQQILQNMQERGQGGSGQELAARLIASQQGADRAGQESDRLSAMTNMQALQALSNQGNLASQMRSQDFGEEERKAAAADAWNRFKAENSQNVANANAQLLNNAQLTNLQNQQAVMNANVGQTNNESLYNSKLLQDDYMNRLRKAAGVAGANSMLANYDLGQAQQSREGWANTLGGIGQIGAAGMQYKQNQELMDRRYPKQSQPAEVNLGEQSPENPNLDDTDSLLNRRRVP